MDARARWARVPAWGRWLLLYVGSAGVAPLLGVLTGVGAGNAVFIAGVAWLLVSIGFIGLGREHRVVVHRQIDGTPIHKERVPEPSLRERNQRGLFYFSVALALWATLALRTLL